MNDASIIIGGLLLDLFFYGIMVYGLWMAMKDNAQKDHAIELYARFREQGLSEVDAVMMIARQTGRAIWDIRIDLGLGIEEA